MVSLVDIDLSGYFDILCSLVQAVLSDRSKVFVQFVIPAKAGIHGLDTGSSPA